jgi:hypothetical protein
MKKIELISFLMLILFASCDERYEEVRGSTFEGTWKLTESRVDSVLIGYNTGNKFLTAREFDGEHLLLFYSGGYYDSSFFFRMQDNNLFVRRVLDSVDVIYRYYEKDSNGNDVLDESGNKIMKIDTIKRPQKPLNPQTNYSPEKYYGTCSFESGTQLKLTIDRYQVNESGAPTTKLYAKDIYSRPVETE